MFALLFVFTGPDQELGSIFSLWVFPCRFKERGEDDMRLRKVLQTNRLSQCSDCGRDFVQRFHSLEKLDQDDFVPWA